MRTEQFSACDEAGNRRSSADQALFALPIPAAIVLGAFVMSRVLSYIAGVRFDASFLQIAWQLLDLQWLREDLAGSLLNLHSQPPLFNLTVGLLAIAVPGYEGVAMQGIYLMLGALLCLAMLDLLRWLGVSAGIAIGVTLLVVLSPANLLYENWLFYSYPVAGFLLFGALGLHRYATTQRVSSGILAFTFIALPALTWSLFHVAWVVLVVGFTKILTGIATRRILAAAAVPLVLVLGWYGKNLVVFGQPAASTWFGQSIFRVAIGGLLPDGRLQLVAETGISDLAVVKTFSPLDVYRSYIQMPEPTGSPALDKERKEDGTPNFNHLAYIAISRRYLELATDLVHKRPELYLGAVARGVCRFFLPSTDYEAFEKNRDRIRWADRVYNVAVYGQLRTPPLDSGCPIGRPMQFPFFFPLLLLGGIAGPTWLALRSSERPEVRVTMAFAALTIVWVVLVGNIFEFGENNRFRFVTEPLMFVGLGVTAHRALEARRTAVGARPVTAS